MTTVTNFTPRSQESQDQAMAITKLRASLKQHAAGSRGTVTQLIADHTTGTPVNIRADLGKPETIKRSLRRERSKHMPKNSASLRELTLDGEWTTTVDGDSFLVYDNGADSSERILVFGTHPGCRRLASSDSWFMDGTFDVAPLLFTQLHVIRVPVAESAVTCIYAFLPNKHQEIYEELFTAIQDRCTQLGFNVDPATVTLDFEQAVMNAIQSTFGPRVHIHGCFYHLTVYMEGPESWVSTTSYRQCTHPRMFLPSLTVYMEEGPEFWVSTTSYRQCTHPRMFLPSHSLHGGRSRVLG